MARLLADENVPIEVVEELHRARPDHEGIIACTFDPDYAGQAQHIHEALPPSGSLRGVLLRVNRPQR